MANENIFMKQGISISFNPSCSHFLRCQFPIRFLSMTHRRDGQHVFDRFLVFLFYFECLKSYCSTPTFFSWVKEMLIYSWQHSKYYAIDDYALMSSKIIRASQRTIEMEETNTWKGISFNPLFASCLSVQIFVLCLPLQPLFFFCIYSTKVGISQGSEFINVIKQIPNASLIRLFSVTKYFKLYKIDTRLSCSHRLFWLNFLLLFKLLVVCDASQYLLPFRCC